MGSRCALFFLALAGFLWPIGSAAQEPPIDFDRARQILERFRRGEEVSPEDKAYVERAKKLRERSPHDRETGAPSSHPQVWTGHLTPLSELGAGKYKGEDGGLYGGGRNEPPKAHLDSALKESARVRPLDPEGRPSPEGKIGVLSVGMSNTTQEYSRFMSLANGDPAKSPAVILVDGAQGGQTATRWADASAPLWQTVDARISGAGLAANQIQIAWIKEAEAGPARLGEFPQHARVLKDNLVTALGNLKRRFPNLRIVYLSSRTYAGYATTMLNPEPYAYEGAFAVRWLIQDQIAGDPALNYDAARGEVKAPLLLWGPYLWADGETPRKGDGFQYQRDDFSEKDGTHPSERGRTKVARLLFDFMKTDPTAKPWFTRR